MQPIYKKILKLSLRILISLFALAMILRQIDTAALGEALRQARLRFVILVWLVAVAGIIIKSFKLKYILQKQNCQTSTQTIFRISAVNSLYRLFMPGVMATPIKWYMLKKDTARGTNVFSGMVYNQYTELAVKLIIGLIAIIISNPAEILFPGQTRGFYLPVAAGIALAGIVAFSILLMNKRLVRAAKVITGWVLRPLPDNIRKKGVLTIDQLGSFQQAGAGFHAAAVLLTLGGSVTASVFMYYFAAMAANIEISLWLIVWLAVFVYVLGRIPISVANLGVREFTIVSLLGLYGVSDSQAFLMSMIIFSSLVFMAMIGVGALVCNFSASR